MQVMLTGGTGFVGGHILRAITAAGHHVNALVRSAEKLDRQLALHGVDGSQVTAIVGDILDPGSVDKALAGCDACVHAAAFTSLDENEMHRALGVNAPGAVNVLDAAVAAGCDPVVHVSTMSVIFPPAGDRLRADDPIQGGGAPYNASKAEADLHARGLQGAGEPIVIVYPAGCTAPLDLGVNIMEATIGQLLANPNFMISGTGGSLMVDTRDIGDGVAALLARGDRPASYMMGGTFLSWSQYADLFDSVTGIERPRIELGRAELTQFIDAEAVDIMLGLVPPHDEPFHDASGVAWRPLEDTLCDTIRWMIDQGRVDPALAPAVAPG